MGACFGAGLIGSLPADLSEDEQFEVMKRFIYETGSPGTFREVIGDRVSEWKLDWDIDNEHHQQRWLDDKEAAPILEYSKNNGGSAPYSWFEYLDGWSVLIPGWDLFQWEFELEIPHLGKEEFHYREYDDFFNAIEKINQRIREDDSQYWEDSRRTKEETIEFHNNLVEDVKNAKRHGMIYVIGD